jgi:hypothetical protein
VDGLMTAIDIDDAQPPHSEDGFRPNKITVVIWPAMHHCIAHGLHLFLQYRFAVQAEETRNTTHTCSLMVDMMFAT